LITNEPAAGRGEFTLVARAQEAMTDALSRLDRDAQTNGAAAASLSEAPGNALRWAMTKEKAASAGAQRNAVTKRRAVESI